MKLRHLLGPVLFLVSLSACAQPAAPAASSRPSAAPAMPNFVPKAGEDYELLPTPQPTYGSTAPGKFEIAEVFSYRCIHCAEFQPKVNAWKKTLGPDISWQYVPAVFGGTWDTFARAYFGAEVLGVQPRTHDLVFKAVFTDQVIKTGTVEEIAEAYGRWGVDKAKMLATMNSFGVTAKLNRARQFALRTGVQATPTIILNGKYRVNVTPGRGFDGMIQTTNWLLAQERAARRPAQPAGGKPAAAKPARKG
jgi:thiol:disulfide interchange protein DsbA